MATYEDIRGYEGLYQISKDGDVFSLVSHKLKSFEISITGYKRVCLFKNGKGKHYSIHRLVAETFIDNPNNEPMVNHKDGNKLNNNIDNLEWCDLSYNIKHAYDNNLIKPRTTRVVQYTKDFIKIKEWASITEACKTLGLNHANIVTVCKQNTNRKYAGGYIWRYV